MSGRRDLDAPPTTPDPAYLHPEDPAADGAGTPEPGAEPCAWCGTTIGEHSGPSDGPCGEAVRRAAAGTAGTTPTAAPACMRCGHAPHEPGGCQVQLMPRPLTTVKCACGGRHEPHRFIEGGQAFDAVDQVYWGPPLCAWFGCSMREGDPVHGPTTNPPAAAHGEVIDTADMRARLTADTLGVNDVDVIIDALDAAREALLKACLSYERATAERDEARAERDEEQAFHGEMAAERDDLLNRLSEAEAHAVQETTEAETWVQRANDEFTRAEKAELDARNHLRERDAAHIEVADRTAERDAARDLAAALEAELAQVRALHFVTASASGPGATNCGGCSHSWPCPTSKALDGEHR